MSKFSRLDHYTGTIFEIRIAASEEIIVNALMVLLKTTNYYQSESKCSVYLDSKH